MADKNKRKKSDKNMQKRSGNHGQDNLKRRANNRSQVEAKRYAESRKREEERRRTKEEKVAVVNAKKHNKHSFYRMNRAVGNKKSKKTGYIIMGMQIIATLIFLLSLFLLNVLPMNYFMIIAVGLSVLVLVVFVSQFFARKKGIVGKVLSIFISIVLFVGSFYVYRANQTMEDISGGNTKLDKFVVAVLSDNRADELKDTASYNFGVQYKVKGIEMQSTVNAINTELGRGIQTTECESVYEQAKMLLDNEVDAIILDEAYMPLLKEQYDGFEERIKIIYTHSIEKQVEGLVVEQVKVEQEPFIVYISGIDVYGEIETNSRSDVNILAIVNPNSHQILLVTTPRDYFVPIPGISGGACDKLTHAGIYGVDASMSTLEELYDIEVDFYARVNFTSLIQMVDALGGVDVESEVAFTTSKAAGCVVSVQEGINHFNGEQALAFCRERKNLEDGDNQRGKHQQAVITAMIQKAVSPAILAGANELLASVGGNVDTNMSVEQMQILIKSQLRNPAAWMIKSVAATGTGATRSCYSSGDTPLYVCIPDDSAEEISLMVDAVEQGQIFKDSKIAR